jgi:hypothetical protein
MYLRDPAGTMVEVNHRDVSALDRYGALRHGEIRDRRVSETRYGSLQSSRSGR